MVTGNAQRLTCRHGLCLSMQQQTHAAQLSLDVEPLCLLPGSAEAQHMRMRMETLMIQSLLKTACSLALTAETLG